MDDEAEMVGFLQRESVDFVVACDMTRHEIVCSRFSATELNHMAVD